MTAEDTDCARQQNGCWIMSVQGAISTSTALSWGRISVLSLGRPESKDSLVAWLELGPQPPAAA